MPVLSMFYGIIIYMFFFDDRKHHRPHIHAHYGEDVAVIAIEGGEVLDGNLPSKKMKLVRHGLKSTGMNLWLIGGLQ